MRLRNYKDDLIQRLKDPQYAAAYLAQVLEEGDKAAFLIALKDVVEAGGGWASWLSVWPLSGRASTEFSQERGIVIVHVRIGASGSASQVPLEM